jgi:filamentous hemagglutinin family protein
MSFLSLFLNFTKYNFGLGLILTVVFLINSSQRTRAQIAPDNSLPNNSSVIQKGLIQEINGGTTRGDNLFHSFAQFSVSPGQTAYFNNVDSIKNIIGRVTGSDISGISGILKANGNANLFLLNQNGIIFGQGAGLNIGGSFLVTTANSLSFTDGNIFFSDPSKDRNFNLDKNPYQLTFNGSTISNITAVGSGHRLIAPGVIPNTNGVFGAGLSQNGLRVKPGKTIAFFGGNINFDGGVLTAPSGVIEISALNSGNVILNPSGAGWDFIFSDANYGNISFTNRSLTDTSGIGKSFTQIRARSIILKDGSLILSQNQGIQNGGSINIFASEKIFISGTDPVARIPGGIGAESIGINKSSSIDISVPILEIFDGGIISTRSYSSGNAGDISITTPNYTLISGTSPRDARVSSSINSFSTRRSSGKAGNVNILTKDFFALDGGSVGSITSGSGKGGDITINASNSINLIGVEFKTLLPSSIGSSTFGIGSAGNVKVNTSKLMIHDGGRLDSSTVAFGSAGSITVNASDFVEVSGFVKGSLNPSLISSSASLVDPQLAQLFGVPLNITGSSGSITINTSSLRILNGGTVSVKNDGSGDAGTVFINSNSIKLFGGNIVASTNGGNGGNIKINTNILAQKNGQINSTAKFLGNGGNTTILASGIAGDYQSTIAANADQGFGGNISIDTLALVFPLSNITATSQRGLAFDGSVNIKSVEFTRIDQVEKQPVLLGRSLPEICNTSINERKFLITAADIPDDVDDLRESDSTYSKVPYSIDNKTGKKILDIGIQGWVKRPDGKGVPIAFNDLAFGGSYLVNACRELSKNHAVKN